MDRLHANQGEWKEIQHNIVFKIDACPDNIDRELKSTCNQCHLMRSVVLCHLCFRKREMNRRNTSHQKRKLDVIKIL